MVAGAGIARIFANLIPDKPYTEAGRHPMRGRCGSHMGTDNDQRQAARSAAEGTRGHSERSSQGRNDGRPAHGQRIRKPIRLVSATAAIDPNSPLPNWPP